MYITKYVVIFILHYTIVWVNKISPCIGEVFANGSVTVDGNTAILTLTASVNGTFQCKLDGSFHTCYSGDIYNNLTAGWHSIEVMFTPDGLTQVILLPSSLDFYILPVDCGNLSAPANGGSGTVPTCSPIVCEDPGNPANGSSNVLAESNSTLAIGTVIKYMCLPGFKLVGSIERVCQPNGEWNGTMPICQPVCQSVINCGYPGVPNHGSVTLYDTTVGCEAVYECDPGYKLVGNATHECQPNGKWSGTQPTCERVDCGNPEEISNGMAIFVDTLFKSLVFYRCDDGFKLVGDSFHICGTTGAWSGVVPSCQSVDCGRPAIPDNTFAIYKNTTVGSTVTYFCNSSHVLCGSDTCLPNGTWTGSVHNCISRAVVNMAHTAYTINEGDEFANITVILDQPSCITATVIAVPQIQTPRDAGKLDFDNTPIPCDISPGDTSGFVSIRIINGIIVERDEKFDVILQSNNSDVIVGSSKQATVTIIDNDAIRVYFKKSTYAIKNKWVKVCLKKIGIHGFPITVLLHHLDPKGSAMSNKSLRFNPLKSKVCYRQSAIGGENITSFTIAIIPSKHVKIGIRGTTQIIIRCEVPGKPTNGQHYFRSIQVGSTVTHSCDDGLELVGDRSRDCLDTGHWSGSVPDCIPVPTNCSMEGQLYLPCDGSATDCDLTCTDPPIDFCFGCKPKCRCPSGTVLDEIAKRCVKRDECSKNR